MKCEIREVIRAMLGSGVKKRAKKRGANDVVRPSQWEWVSSGFAKPQLPLALC